jgi:hypothetical protein
VSDKPARTSACEVGLSVKSPRNGSLGQVTAHPVFKEQRKQPLVLHGRLHRTSRDFNVQRGKDSHLGIRRLCGLRAGDGVCVGHSEDAVHISREAPRLQVFDRRRLQVPLPGCDVGFGQHIRFTTSPCLTVARRINLPVTCAAFAIGGYIGSARDRQIDSAGAKKRSARGASWARMTTILSSLPKSRVIGKFLNGRPRRPGKLPKFPLCGRRCQVNLVLRRL